MPIAIFQANPTMGAIADNAAALLSAAHSLKPGALLLVAPELYLLGYPPDDLVNAPGVLLAVRAALDDLAAALPDKLSVLVGAPIADARGTRNAAVLIARGQWRVVAEKMILPDDGVFDDKRIFVPGMGPGVIEIDGKAIGVMVCEDCWHPQPLEKLLAGADAPLAQIIVINASPFERTKMARRYATVRVRIQRARVPFLYLNMVGGQDEILFDGGSFVMDARGNIVEQFPQFEECVIPVKGLSLGACAERKLRARVPEPAVKLKPQTPAQGRGDIGEVYHAIVLGTRDYARKNGFSKVCLGLSGGVDSALVATIAVDALGPGNVTAMMMPSEYSSAETQSDARQQAPRLGIYAIEMPITPAQHILTENLTSAFGGKLHDITAQNLQSRLRGLALMALSNQTGALLLTTGNKSEMASGYATLYGDMNGGFNPIKDLYKTDVYDICAWRNANSIGGLAQPILPSIIARAPSAELSPGQTDQDTLPPYAVLDEVLRALIEGNAAPELLAKFDAELVQKIQGWLDKNEYKRRQSAPGVKVTRKAFGRDRRWPMTSQFKG